MSQFIARPQGCGLTADGCALNQQQNDILIWHNIHRHSHPPAGIISVSTKQAFHRLVNEDITDAFAWGIPQTPMLVKLCSGEEVWFGITSLSFQS
jgi:hypothetical protein